MMAINSSGLKACSLCGHATLVVRDYQDCGGDKSVSRLVKDLLLCFIWWFRFVDRIPNKKLIRRLSQGLFKFRKVAVCTKCGHGQIHPLPTDRQLQRFYSKSYQETDALEALPDLHFPPSPKCTARIFSTFVFIEENVNLSNINNTLDIGGGFGDLSRYIKHSHPDVIAAISEPSAKCRTLVQASGEIDTAFSKLDEVNDVFDLVTASHVLEHVTDPVDALKEWAGLVRPGGYLFIEVPHANEDHYTVTHEYIPHTHFFTVESMRCLTDRLGLDAKLIATGGPTWAAVRQGVPIDIEQEGWSKNGETGCLLRALFSVPQ